MPMGSLADVSKAVIVGFNVVPDPAAQKLAEQKNVTIRMYRVIYDLTDALRRSLQGLLEPEKRMETRGRAEVRERRLHVSNGVSTPSRFSEWPRSR
jgi:translation initiation factor IF-2